MPKNVMKLLKPSPHRARNDFDLSHRHVYSANFGELLPSTCIETVPGDHIVMHSSDLLRAIPLVTSPFLRAKQHIDVWFVPFRDLWHNFDQFMVQKDQPVSSALNSSTFVPHANLWDLWNYAVLNSDTITDVVGRPVQNGASRILNLLGYGNPSNPIETSPKVNLFRLAAYNYIWYNEYRQKYYDDGSRLLNTGANVATLFNFDSLPCNSEASANIDYFQSTFVNQIIAMCQMRYRTWKKDLFTGLMPSTQFGSVSSVSTLSFDTNTTSGIPYGFYSSTGDSVIDRASGIIQGSPSTIDVSTRTGLKASFDVLTLRRSEAIQIWRENALRAGNRVSDNMRAHYGL